MSTSTRQEPADATAIPVDGGPAFPRPTKTADEMAADCVAAFKPLADAAAGLISLSIRDGGPAFPRPASFALPDGDHVINEQDGMTLRDYLAAKAMQAELVGDQIACKDTEFDPAAADEIAARAYVQADAMLKARAEK